MIKLLYIDLFCGAGGTTTNNFQHKQILITAMNITQKQEYRYQFAGMAMQAMINAIWSNPTTQDEVTATAKRKGYSCLRDWVADEAADYADTLIKELDSKDKP